MFSRHCIASSAEEAWHMLATICLTGTCTCLTSCPTSGKHASDQFAQYCTQHRQHCLAPLPSVHCISMSTAWLA
jgi:hypothetical protein